MKLISIVTPCFNEELNIKDCFDRVEKVFSENLKNYKYEHIFCDNFSSDGTMEILRSLAKKHRHIKVIANSRNFGPFSSMFNGVLASSGEAVIPFLPADCQDPPEVLIDFISKWENGSQVVFGVRENRQENWLLKFVRKAYYRTVKRISNIDIPNDVGEFTLIDKAVVDSLREVNDYYPYLRGLIANAGFVTSSVPYTWEKRRKGKSKLNIYALVDQGLNGLISFTNLPMRLTMLSGVIMAVASVLYALWVFLSTLISGDRLAQPGITTLLVANFFFYGLVLLSIGVLGEYISAIHFQVRKRPLVIERERINFDGDSK